jgi:hypothetical protein
MRPNELIKICKRYGVSTPHKQAAKLVEDLCLLFNNSPKQASKIAQGIISVEDLCRNIELWTKKRSISVSSKMFESGCLALHSDPKQFSECK